jgi:hypothetical protein
LWLQLVAEELVMGNDCDYDFNRSQSEVDSNGESPVEADDATKFVFLTFKSMFIISQNLCNLREAKLIHLAQRIVILALFERICHSAIAVYRDKVH